MWSLFPCWRGFVFSQPLSCLVAMCSRCALVGQCLPLPPLCSMSDGVFRQPRRRLWLFLVCLLSPVNKGLGLRLGKAVVQEVDLFASIWFIYSLWEGIWSPFWKCIAGVNAPQGEEQFHPKGNVSTGTNGYKLAMNYLDLKLNEGI